MKEIRYFYCPEMTQGELPKEEAEHAVRVLRMQIGDPLLLTDGKGGFYHAEITAVTKKSCGFRIITQEKIISAWKGWIALGVAPTKNMDRMEWLTEKATEIGIDSIHFLNCQYSERKNMHTERLQRIAISAMKQSHKAWLPQISEMESFQEFIHTPFDGIKAIAHCYDDRDINESAKKTFLMDALQENKTENVMILIGPEGDFSIEEVREAIGQGFLPVSLGESRLRTETAALCALMMTHLRNRKA